MRAPRASVLLALACAAVVLPSQAHAQLPPAGVRLLAPFAAGGPIDFSARVLAESMQAQTGTPVIVENRTGANGAIAANAVKQAAPNGATLLVATSGLLTISPHTQDNAPDLANDLVPIIALTYVDTVLAIGSHVSAKSLNEFIELARNAQQPLALGSAGVGNVTHGLTVLLSDVAKVKLLNVPYRGIAAALTDVLGGQIAGTWPAFNLALPHMKTGKITALGVVGNKRSELAPEIPTLTEQGYPGVDFITWTAIMGPRNIPPEVTSALRGAIARAITSEEARAKLAAVGIAPWLITPEEFSRTVQDERERWRKLIKERNIFGG
jgi:tripartite-type tricarboxylate transporter receptor subunit TctC